MPDVVFFSLRRWRANTLVSGGGTIHYTACFCAIVCEKSRHPHNVSSGLCFRDKTDEITKLDFRSIYRLNEVHTIHWYSQYKFWFENTIQPLNGYSYFIIHPVGS